ncbi:MAG: mannose-1-phosphate guanylyltransferase/mannose-6-phosphate isomerase [Pseudomonadota bacterium]|nr:mannose-1-phosphate guanylyltransferase/mannose-6-phosphate isomerase [Pseudomonadota bacterium]
MKKIYPMILCGGTGTRLWPVSRQSYPKQFVHLNGDSSLFQDTVKRVQTDLFAEPLIVTADDYRFIVRDQMAKVNAKPLVKIVEPIPKNTAPAILAAALSLFEQDPKAIMLVLSSDHWIEDDQAFRSTVNEAFTAAEMGKIITFGIKPTHPETGYGYLSLSDQNGDGPYPLKAFVEKPDLEQAKKLLEDGMHLWNAGIFMFRVDVIIEAFKTYQPEMYECVRLSYELANQDIDFIRLNQQHWSNIHADSIDYAIMEKASELMVMPFTAQWSDLGSWKAFYDIKAKDVKGNAIHEKAIGINCENTLLEQTDIDQALVGIGLKDLSVVVTKDAVLVAHKDESQTVKKAVATLASQSRYQAKQFLKVHRPWGWYQTLALGEQYQVKEIFVNPGAQLSLQSHRYRAEHWVVVMGEATVLVGEKESVLLPNESTYIPIGEKHRLTNHTNAPVMIIETQTGTYLGEDDIIRYEDIYNRSSLEVKEIS